MTRSFEAVVTTIRPPSPSLIELARRLPAAGGRLTVLGDRAGPDQFDLPGCRFVSIDEQKALPFRLAAALSEGTYARKNLGFLSAMRRGASCIYETDDDNAPAADWQARNLAVAAERIEGTGWINAYRFFTEEAIWPRGFPLSRIRADMPITNPPRTEHFTAPIQQGLTDVAPDVDAIWRLVFGADRELTFRRRSSIWLSPGVWCPFNSQNTWWWAPAFPLMYLPSGCSFRMTDIWRGLVAQRCLWEGGLGLVFNAPDVAQRRNEHDLMRDFADEIPGYLRTDEFVSLLMSLSLSRGPRQVSANIRQCYEALVTAGHFPASELSLLDAWLSDVDDLVLPGNRSPSAEAEVTHSSVRG